jgi:hypothetical protein
MKERIDGLKFDLHHLNDVELETLKSYTAQRVEEALRDLDKIRAEEARRFNVELPLGRENYAQVLGAAVTRGEATITEASEALESYGRVTTS